MSDIYIYYYRCYVLWKCIFLITQTDLYPILKRVKPTKRVLLVDRNDRRREYNTPNATTIPRGGQTNSILYLSYRNLRRPLVLPQTVTPKRKRKERVDSTTITYNNDYYKRTAAYNCW